MKKVLFLATLLASLPSVHAQQAVPREEVLKAALILSADLKQMLGTPIPTDPDVKRSVAVRGGERGGLAMPECKLSADTLAKAGKEVIPVGQVWLRGVIPQSDGQPVKQEKLLAVTVGAGDKSATVLLCALGARKDADGKLELLVYGKDKEPILRLPLKAISTPQENPIEMSAEPQGEGAVVTLKILGKYQAVLTVVTE